MNNNTACRCGDQLVVRQAHTGDRAGESYYSCPNWRGKETPGCGFFKWVNHPASNNNNNNNNSPSIILKRPAQRPSNDSSEQQLKQQIDKLRSLIERLETIINSSTPMEDGEIRE
jgi:hypothetical protein